MPTAVKERRSTSEILNEAAQKTTRTAITPRVAANDQKAVSIESNPFYEIFSNTELTPTQQQAAIAKLRVASEDKEKNRESKEAYEVFVTWLQEKRQAWAMKMISLVDTEVFSALKKFYANMNNGVIEFNDSLKDLTDVLEGLDELRVNGKTLDAFAEIKNDKEEEARREEIRKEQKEKADRILADKETAAREIAALQEEKRPWIFGGGIKKDARIQIAQKQLDIESLDGEITALTAEREKTEAEFAAKPTATMLDEKLAGAKEKLRQLLELSDTEHNGRQERLVKAALDFVQNTKADTAEALQHLDGLGDQYVKLLDNAKSMRNTVLILNEGTKDATSESRKLYEALSPPPEEGEIARMEREEKQAAVRDHVTDLELSAGDRVSMLKDLTELSSRANSMRETNEQEMQRVRTMNLNGVAGTAERLVTVLNGVDSAALHQGAEMTQSSLDAMHRSTHDLLAKGVVAHAVGMLEENDRLSQAIGELEELSNKTRQATEVTRQALSEGASIRAENEARVAQLKSDMEEYLKSAAVMRSDAVEQTSRKVAASVGSPKKKSVLFDASP